MFSEAACFYMPTSSFPMVRVLNVVHALIYFFLHFSFDECKSNFYYSYFSRCRSDGVEEYGEHSKPDLYGTYESLVHYNDLLAPYQLPTCTSAAAYESLLHNYDYIEHYSRPMPDLPNV